MTRVRLRPAMSATELAEAYAKPHDHTEWVDHQVRVAVTIQLAHALVGPARSAADLSCGDGAILRALAIRELHLGDLASGRTYTGPIQETVQRIPTVDLFVCSETIEHLDDPDAALAAIRPKARALILSTPVGAWNDANSEHYWAWSRQDVEVMLAAAGFRTIIYNGLDCRPGGGDYEFGIWGCR